MQKTGSINQTLRNAYHSLGQYEKTLQYHETNLEISTAIGNDQSGIARGNGDLGNVYRILGQYEKAIKYHEKDSEVSIAISQV